MPTKKVLNDSKEKLFKPQDLFLEKGNKQIYSRVISIDENIVNVERWREGGFHIMNENFPVQTFEKMIKGCKKIKEKTLKFPYRKNDLFSNIIPNFLSSDGRALIKIKKVDHKKNIVELSFILPDNRELNYGIYTFKGFLQVIKSAYLRKISKKNVKIRKPDVYVGDHYELSLPKDTGQFLSGYFEIIKIDNDLIRVNHYFTISNIVTNEDYSFNDFKMLLKDKLIKKLSKPSEKISRMKRSIKKICPFQISDILELNYDFGIDQHNFTISMIDIKNKEIVIKNYYKDGKTSDGWKMSLHFVTDLYSVRKESENFDDVLLKKGDFFKYRIPGGEESFFKITSKNKSQVSLLLSNSWHKTNNWEKKVLPIDRCKKIVSRCTKMSPEEASDLVYEIQCSTKRKLNIKA